jgi:hypothetical protein
VGKLSKTAAAHPLTALVMARTVDLTIKPLIKFREGNMRSLRVYWWGGEWCIRNAGHLPLSERDGHLFCDSAYFRPQRRG